jgi:hypothetical protein
VRWLASDSRVSRRCCGRRKEGIQTTIPIERSSVREVATNAREACGMTSEESIGAPATKCLCLRCRKTGQSGQLHCAENAQRRSLDRASRKITPGIRFDRHACTRIRAGVQTIPQPHCNIWSTDRHCRGDFSLRLTISGQMESTANRRHRSDAYPVRGSFIHRSVTVR